MPPRIGQRKARVDAPSGCRVGLAWSAHLRGVGGETRLARVGGLASCDGRGDAASGEGNYEEALHWYERAAATEPRDADVSTRTANTRLQPGHAAAAEDACDSAAAAVGDTLQARRRLALLYVNQGRYAQGAKLAEQLRDEGDHSESVLAATAVAQLNLGNMRSAMSAAAELLERDPKQPEGLLVLGVGQWQAGQMREVGANLRTATSVGPKRSEPWSDLAAVLAIGGDFAAAIEAGSRALSLEPGDIQALYVRAGCHLQHEEYDRAIADCQAILRIDPNHAAARAQLRQARHR